MLLVALCTVFVLPLGLGNENRISQYFKNLFDAAAARNDTNKRQLEEALHTRKREQEEAFDTLKDTLKSSIIESKQRYQSSSIKQNVTIKREAAAKGLEEDYEPFNREALEKETREDMKLLANDELRFERMMTKFLNAKAEIARLMRVVGKKDKEKSLIAIPMEVLQVRDAMEKRIDGLYGATGKPAKKSYISALEDALTSKEYHITSNPWMMEFRSVVRETGFEDMDSFVDIVKVLYRDFSFGQAHKITGGLTQLPSYGDEKRIRKILGSAGVCQDDPYVKAIQAFLKPLEEMGKKAPGVNERCVIFKTMNERQREEFKPSEAKIWKEDILLAFPEIKPLRAAWVSYTDKKKQRKVYMIQVEFDTEENAKNGCSNNHGWLKQFKVEPKLSSCYNEQDSEDEVIEEIVSRDNTVANPNGVTNSTD